MYPLLQRGVQLLEAEPAGEVRGHVIERGLVQKRLAVWPVRLLKRLVYRAEALFNVEVRSELVVFALAGPHLASLIMLADEVRADFVVKHVLDERLAVAYRQRYDNFSTSILFVHYRCFGEALRAERVLHFGRDVEVSYVRVKALHCLELRVCDLLSGCECG